MSKHLMCAAIERLREKQKENENLRNTISMRLDEYSPEIKNDLDKRSELEREIEKGCNSTQIFLKIVTELNAINEKIDALSPEIKSAIYTRHYLNRQITFARNTLIDYARYKKCPCMSGSQPEPCQITVKLNWLSYCQGCEHLQPKSAFSGHRWLEGQPASDARWQKRAIAHHQQAVLAEAPLHKRAIDAAEEHACSTAKKQKHDAIVLSSDEESAPTTAKSQQEGKALYAGKSATACRGRSRSPYAPPPSPERETKREPAFADGKWHADVKVQMTMLEEMGKLKEADLDQEALKALKTLPYEVALVCLNKIANETSAIRNINAFIVQNCKHLRNTWGVDDAASSSAASSSSDDDLSEDENPMPPKSTPMPPKSTPMPPKSTPMPPKSTPMPPKSTPMPPKSTRGKSMKPYTRSRNIPSGWLANRLQKGLTSRQARNEWKQMGRDRQNNAIQKEKAGGKAQKPALSAEHIDIAAENVIMKMPAYDNGFHQKIKEHPTWDALDGLGKQTYDLLANFTCAEFVSILDTLLPVPDDYFKLHDQLLAALKQHAASATEFKQDGTKQHAASRVRAASATESEQEEDEASDKLEKEIDTVPESTFRTEN
jgi:hypothetical protein